MLRSAEAFEQAWAANPSRSRLQQLACVIADDPKARENRRADVDPVRDKITDVLSGREIQGQLGIPADQVAEPAAKKTCARNGSTSTRSRPLQLPPAPAALPAASSMA